jgi:hypothetical protein
MREAAMLRVEDLHVAVDNSMISEMDLNPVLVLEKGVTVLDARVIIGE